MIALLLAAQVAAAPPPAALLDQALVRPRIVYTGRRLAVPACNAPARYQTSNPEPALLLRPQDERAREGVKRLIDMPMGRFCLTGGSPEEAR